ncbi:hypothetical protein C5167_013701 [Papaver somniferum]|uniref:Uncharacterized protein n=1 Tax=Papaver somniferum TaxID=3469 RepID=A0A4Y7J467_PAPSO|nr:hypothetical protein C5167_013701 [Papaver somniferum]
MHVPDLLQLITLTRCATWQAVVEPPRKALLLSSASDPNLAAPLLGNFPRKATPLPSLPEI